MNPIRFSFLRHGLVASVLVLALGACDSSNALREDDLAAPALMASVEQIDQSLALSPDLRDAVKAAFAAHEDKVGTPGFLWYVADDLQASLSAEQKADLLARQEQRLRRPGDRPRHMQGHRPGPHRFGNNAMARIPDLTDDQRAALDSIRAVHREQFQTLRQQHRNGAQDSGAIRSDMRSVIEAMREDVQAVLTAEQQAYLNEQRLERQTNVQQRRNERREQRRAFAEEAHAVAADVLDLTDEQQQTLREWADAQRGEFRALRDDLRAGEVNRNDAAKAFQARRNARLETLSATLTPDQLETVQIHRALLHHTMQPRFKQRAR